MAQDGSQSAVEPHGRAAKAAESAGIAVSDGTDPLDAAWALDPSDPRVKAFAQAYARELSDAGIAAGATAKGAGSIRACMSPYAAPIPRRPRWRAPRRPTEASSRTAAAWGP